MGRIRVLEPEVANQIAAGEVVERPSSVVKELVENSLDSAASEIRIQANRGGIGEIRVADDGEGMDRQDLLLALERHATSKLSRLEQLASLRTLGFRGEALPSIASVSRMRLESSPGTSGEGVGVRVEGGRAFPPEVVGHPRGTTVMVRSLFFNAPARRKFLRSEGTEADHIADVVSRAALAHFDRRFTLTTDGKVVLDAAPAADRKERIRQLFGQTLADRLIPFSRETGAYRVSGFASLPEFTRATTRDLRIFINGRPIRDRGLLHAIGEAYHTLLPRGRHPFVLVFLEIPPERVDINVHPTKAEVRLADPRVMHETVRLAIRIAFDQERPVGRLRRFAPPPPTSGIGDQSAPPASTSLLDYGNPGAPSTLSPPAMPTLNSPAGLYDPSGSRGLGTMLPLAQYRESYIVATDAEGLVIVDQHVAHERVLYEQILREAGRAQIQRQVLLFPLPIEVDPSQARRLAEGRGDLERLGFVMEPFGEFSFLVREAPALLGHADLPPVLRDLADDLQGSIPARGLGKVWDRLAATTACHAAVKVNCPLTLEKMTYLLAELTRTESPMTCPHGRPILLRLNHKDLERNFHRR